MATYRPFGTSVSASGTEKFKYAGEMLVDVASTSPGLYYIGARWMDPELGRWLSLDLGLGRLSQPQSMNRYVYCVNNPLRFTDPTGEWFGVSWKDVSNWWDKNWQTVAVIAICLAATVFLPIAGGFVAGVLISATAQGVMDFATTLAKSGGDWRTAGKAGLMGALEGAVAGAIGGGVGKIATAGLRSIVTGEAKAILGGASSKIGASLRGGVGKVLPGVGAKLEQAALGRDIAAGFKLLGQVQRTGVSSDVAWRVGTKQAGELFEMSLERYGLSDWIRTGEMTTLTKQGYMYRIIIGGAEEFGSLAISRTIGLPSYLG
ncbi:MAG: RHS repeat-associated core domain-containing protein [Thermoplasmata archaeon]